MLSNTILFQLIKHSDQFHRSLNMLKHQAELAKTPFTEDRLRFDWYVNSYSLFDPNLLRESPSDALRAFVEHSRRKPDIHDSMVLHMSVAGLQELGASISRSSISSLVDNETSQQIYEQLLP